MGTLEWNKKLETGNPLMDSQHELLVQKILACIEASQNFASKDELVIALECVIRCLADHFDSEETKLLEEGLLTGSHLNQHGYILEHLENQITMLKEGNPPKGVSAQGVLFPLYDWCVDHFMNEDACLARCRW